MKIEAEFCCQAEQLPPNHFCIDFNPKKNIHSDQVIEYKNVLNFYFLRSASTKYVNSLFS